MTPSDLGAVHYSARDMAHITKNQARNLGLSWWGAWSLRIRNRWRFRKGLTVRVVARRRR